MTVLTNLLFLLSLLCKLKAGSTNPSINNNTNADQVLASHDHRITSRKLLRYVQNPTLPQTFAHKIQRTSMDNSKPTLVLHIGPSKTGTTSLQTDLSNFEKEMAMDNYTYAGRYYHPYHKHGGDDDDDNENSPLLLNRTESDLLVELRTMLDGNCKLLPRTKCCTKFKTLLDGYKEKGKNVILSDESLNHQWDHPYYYETMKEILNDEWNVLLVIGYRRFFEWLPSFKYQRDRLDHEHIKRKDNWPGRDGGKPAVPLFPNAFHNWWLDFPHTDFALNNNQNTFPIKVMSLHHGDYKSIRSLFLCHILSDTPNACKESLNQDEIAIQTTTMNERGTDPSFFYDTITTEAAEKGMVNRGKWKRRQVIDAVQAHFEIELNHTSAWELPLSCPSAKQLGEFLITTLVLESKYMPETIVDNEDTIIAKFEKQVSQKVFCWVNANAVLHDDEWITFFKRFH